jgi:hypothetical protein
VLALGHPPPNHPVAGNLPLYDSLSYVRDPWSAGALAGLDPDATLLVIGTNLTMFDLAMALDARGHRGVIHAISRHGLLSLAHGPAPTPGIPWNATDPPRSARAALRALRRQARVEPAGWRGVVDWIRAQTPALWSSWPDAERRRFLRHARPYWDVHRHRAAPEIHDRIDRMRADGRLRVDAARLTSLELRGDGVVATIAPRGGRATVTLAVTRVINATGPSVDYRSWDDPLVRVLFDRGWIRPGRSASGSTQPRRERSWTGTAAPRPPYPLSDRPCAVRSGRRPRSPRFARRPRDSRLGSWQASRAPARDLAPSSVPLGRRHFAYQIEGGITGNDWADWERLPGKVRDGGLAGEACGSWEHWARDLDRIQALGLNAYRFSLEWSRIEPEEGRFDEAALARYRAILSGCRERGITPVLTLHHFTNPRWFLARGGWEERANIAAFERYARLAGERYGDLVDVWITINEPEVYGFYAYDAGIFPPGLRDRVRALRVIANLLEAHGVASQALRQADRVDADGDGHAALVGAAKHWVMLEPRTDGRRWTGSPPWYSTGSLTSPWRARLRADSSISGSRACRQSSGASMRSKARPIFSASTTTPDGRSGWAETGP